MSSGTSLSGSCLTKLPFVCSAERSELAAWTGKPFSVWSLLSLCRKRALLLGFIRLSWLILHPALA